MATLEMSSALLSGLPERIMSPSLGTVTLAYNSGNVPYPLTPLVPYDVVQTTSGNIVGYLNIYQGTVPTNFSTLTAYDSRTADILLSYESRLVNDFIESSVFTTNPAVLNTEYKTSYLSRTGTATWFRWFTYIDNAPYNLIHQIIGEVGTPGSGKDLIISSTNITATGLYKISKIRLNFSGTFVY